MKNPWLARNPFLSLWMSGANAMLGAARGHAANAARRQQAAASRAMVDLWSGAARASAPKAARKRRARQR